MKLSELILEAQKQMIIYGDGEILIEGFDDIEEAHRLEHIGEYEVKYMISRTK